MKRRKILIYLFLPALMLLMSELSYASNKMMHVSIQQIIKEKKISLDVKDKTLEQILTLISEKTKLNYGYQSNIDVNMRFTLKVSNSTIEETLDKLFKESPYTYELVDDKIVILAKKELKQPTKAKKSEIIDIYGKVINSDNQPVVGATVIVGDNGGGTITNDKGEFAVKINVGEVIEISFVGMETVKYKPTSNDTKPVIKMSNDILAVDEVVVTGFGEVKRSSYTGNTVTIKRDELMKASKTNVMKALETFDPSFRIKENNMWGSDPNALPEVSIRGNSGIGVKELDKDPLSKSTLKDNPNLPTYIMDGFEISASKLYDFDMNRIESITILKDAAATALYGSRAANGVIVITTVTPKMGKINVDYSFIADITTPDLKDYNLLNASEKLEVERRAGIFTYSTNDIYLSEYKLKKEYYDKLGNINEGVDTYWLNMPLKTTFNHRHSLYIDGGSENFRFGIDLQYAKQDGVMKGSGRDRVNAGVFLQYNYKNLTIKNQVSYQNTKSSESNYGNFADFAKQLPYDRYKDENGVYFETMKMWGTGSTHNKMNPMYEPSLHNSDRSNRDEFINNLSVNWRITPDLLLKGQMSLTKTIDNRDRFYDPLSKNTSNINLLSAENISSGTLYKNGNDSFSLDMNATLSYNKYFKGHAINTLAGVSVKEDTYNSNSATYLGFPSGALSSAQYAREMYQKTNFAESTNRMIGVLATINYSYNEIYLLDASVRVDGSSVFGADKRYAPFWSIGAGINIHNYEYFKNIKWLNQLKIRASYGQTGKANFPAYASRSSYQLFTDEWYKTGYGGVLKALGNKNLKWETTNTFDIGGEISFFNNALYIKGTYYNKLTIDLISDITVPTSTGFRSYRDNVGELTNKGYEFDLRLRVINTKDLSITFTGNIAHNKNRLTKISDSMKAYNELVKERFNKQFATTDPDRVILSQPFIQYEEGISLNSIWGVRSLGINPSDGKEVYLSRNGRWVKNWNTSDQVVLGILDPKVQGSFGVSATYKQFSLYTSFMYEAGGQRYNQTLVDKVENANIYIDNVDARVLNDRWSKPGDISKYKSLVTGRESVDITRPTSRFVQDYNMLSWSSLELSYDLPYNITEKLHMSMVRFTAGMNDILHMSNVNQERGISYPYARSVNFSVKISF